jgi:hypothetical protein
LLPATDDFGDIREGVPRFDAAVGDVALDLVVLVLMLPLSLARESESLSSSL